MFPIALYGTHFKWYVQHKDIHNNPMHAMHFPSSHNCDRARIFSSAEQKMNKGAYLSRLIKSEPLQEHVHVGRFVCIFKLVSFIEF